MSNMMHGWYVPTTEEVCSGFRGDPRKFEQAGEPIDAIGSNYGSKCYAAFHRWLAAHDAEVRNKALSLTDDELAIAEGAYESSVMSYEGDGLMAMSIAFKAVAEDRRKQ